MTASSSLAGATPAASAAWRARDSALARGSKPRAVRRAPPRRAPISVRAGFWDTNPTHLGGAADDAARRAADKWASLDARPPDGAQLDAARAAEAEARRVAAEAEAKSRDAEASAHLWEERARSVRSDLEAAQTQLAEFRSALAEFQDQPDAREVDAARARAVAEAEQAARRADQAQRELEETRRLAAEAARDGGARVAAAERRAAELERGVEHKDRELRSLRLDLEKDIQALREDLRGAEASRARDKWYFKNNFLKSLLLLLLLLLVLLVHCYILYYI